MKKTLQPKLELVFQELCLWRGEVLIENARPHAHKALEMLGEILGEETRKDIETHVNRLKGLQS